MANLQPLLACFYVKLYINPIYHPTSKNLKNASNKSMSHFISHIQSRSSLNEHISDSNALCGKIATIKAFTMLPPYC